MSDSEEEACYFGTPLEPYDEDAFPKKRPITVEEQVAKDAQGRRRFHGAFTGGFSAGFYNTVGSLEGWRPAEFKSSRSEKANNKQQKPEDYMDDEDVGEFGIAPQTVRATTDYATSKKRKKQVFSDGPIPGEPVLETLLQAGNETVGYFLMKNMNRKQKPEDKSVPKIYGCAMPKDLPDEPIEVPQYHIHEIYNQYLSKPKCNSFGLGYVGLDKTHLNLFQPAKLMVKERNNKKLSISGQAFGVGAFEDDDEDIYVKDDMSRYDFELSAESSSKNKTAPTQKSDLVLDVFVLSKNSLIPQNIFPPPVIPSSFTGKHNVKKSRFAPVAEETQILERKNIDASIRAKYLGEENNQKSYTPSNQQHKPPSMDKTQKREPAKKSTTEDATTPKDQQPSSSGLFDRFVSAKLDDDPTNILEPVKPMEITHGTKEMHDAVKLKMFGPLTRVTLPWQPSSFLCKRFNVPEPHFDLNAQKNKKRTKNLIFEYQKHSESDLLHKPGLSVQTTDAPPDETKTTSDIPDPEIKSDVAPNEIEEATTSHSDLPIQSQKEETENKPSIETEKENKNSDDTIIDITERVDVYKNTDLFKAVFLSSSESESESEVTEVEDEEKKRKELITANAVSEPLVPKIKPTKEGILSNIDFSKFNSSKVEKVNEVEKKSEEDLVNTKHVDDDNTYGPKLPMKVSGLNPVIVKEMVVNNDKWVEKDLVEKQKKHKKKHKKEKVKEKHKKKHKHKSKRYK